MDIKDEIREKLIGGDIEGVKEAVGKARDGGIPAPEILLEALVPGIQEVGRLFEAGEAFLPEMMISAEAMKQGVAEIQSLLESSDIQSNGKVLIATV